MNKPFASLSLDLDDQWTYLKTHGNNAWIDYPTYLDIVLPRILDILDQWSLSITFFIVGQDAAFDYNSDILYEIKKRGHEIGNHTYHHDPWLHTYDKSDIEHEMQLAEEHIERATGVIPVGFRGPGFSFSSSVLEVLMERGYQYDASTLPSVLNSMARNYFLSKSELSDEERELRQGLFGSWRDGFRPNKPFQWVFDDGNLLEIPVTTMPGIKVPIHTSYIQYLGTYNRNLAVAYFYFALKMCKISGTEPSILLHPLDFLGKDDTDQLSFFPAMQANSEVKINLMQKLFQLFTNNYQVMSLASHATRIREKGILKEYTL